MTAARADPPHTVAMTKATRTAADTRVERLLGCPGTAYRLWPGWTRREGTTTVTLFTLDSPCSAGEQYQGRPEEKNGGCMRALALAGGPGSGVAMACVILLASSPAQAADT